MRYFLILLWSTFSCLLGMGCAVSAVQFGPNVSAIIPVTLSFVAIGGLGGGVIAVFKDQDKRIQALEQRAQNPGGI